MDRRLMRVVCAGALAVLMAAPPAANGQTDAGDLVTDRPDFTESSAVVGRGIVQIETGSAFEVDGVGDQRVRTFTTPLALVRVGVSRTLELRFSGDGSAFSSYGLGPAGVTSHGGSDIEIGAKWAFLTGDRRRLIMALIPMLSVPVGSALLSSGTFDPAVKVTWGTSLPYGFGLSGNVNVSGLRDASGRYAEQAHSLSLSHGLGRGWGMYGEGFGFITNGRAIGQAWTLNSGVTYAIGNNTQVDVEVGRGVTAAAPDWFLGFGMGIRTAAMRRWLR